MSLEQTLAWLDRTGISFPHGSMTESVLKSMIESGTEYSYDWYTGSSDLMEDLEAWSKKALAKDKAKIDRFLDSVERKIPSKWRPLEVDNFIANYKLCLWTQQYTRAISHLQKLRSWMQRNSDWVDVSVDITQLESAATEAIASHSKTQAGMTIRSLWENIHTWDGGFSLRSDLNRYGDWLQRIKRALRCLENPNVDTDYRDPHLDRFSSQPVRSSDSPKYVYALARINNTTVHGQTDLALKGEMERPDTSPEVTSTTGDGEVNPLTETLQAFLEHLAVPKNQTSKRTFELSLSGSAGACDGCKKRIARFVKLWADTAESSMKKGVLATLRITYRYLNKAYVARDSLVYGWYEDNKIGGYYYHTVDRMVVGRG